jgi:Rv0078B-related antitoxin
MTDHARAAVLRLRRTFELFEAGERLMRQNLRRRHPDEAPEAIERHLTARLRELIDKAPAPPR